MAESMLPPMILELRARAGEFYAEMARAKKEVASLGTSSEAQAAKSAASSKVTTKALAFIAGGAALIGGESIKSAMDFQKATTLLQTAGGESEANMKLVHDGILAISADTGISADKMAEGMYIVEKSGNRGAAGLDVLRAAAEGATAEGVDVSTMATALTSVMASFGIKSQDAAKAMSAIDRAAGLSKTTMTDFAGALSSVMPAANAAHMQLDGVLANIATLTQHGTSAAQATDELAHTIAKLSGTPTAPMQNAMNMLGISTQDVKNQLAGPNGLEGAIGLFQDAIRKHLGPAGLVVIDTFKQSAQAQKNLQVEMSHMSGDLLANSKALMDGSMTLAQYNKAAGHMPLQLKQQAAGFAATAKQAAGFNTLLTKGNQVQRTAAGALRDLMGDQVSWKTALMLSGDATDKNSGSLAYNTEAMKEIGDQYNKGGKHIATYAETQKTTAVQVAKLKVGLQNLGIEIGEKLLPVFTNIVGWLQRAVGWLSQNWTWVGKIVAVIGGLLVVLKLWQLAQAAINIVMDANPIMMIITAIGLLVAGFMYLWNHSKGFRDFWIGLWNVIKGVVQTAWKIIQGIIEAIVKAFEWVAGIVTKVWDGLKTAAVKVWNWIKDLPANIWNLVKSAWNHVVEWGKQLITWIWEGITGLAHIIWEWITGLPGKIWGYIKGAWNAVTGWGSQLINWILSGITSTAHNIWDWITGLPGRIWDWVKSKWDDFVNWGEDLIHKIVQGIKNVAKDVGDAISAAVTGIDPTALGQQMGNQIAAGIQAGMSPGTAAATAGAETGLTAAGQGLLGNVVSWVAGTGFASGGDLPVSGRSWVGEQGPEVAETVGGKTHVYSAAESQQRFGRPPGGQESTRPSGDVTHLQNTRVVNNHITVAVQSTADPNRIGGALGWVLRTRGGITAPAF